MEKKKATRKHPRTHTVPARIMRRLLIDSIEAFLPEGALEIARGAEEPERAGLRTLAAGMSKGDDHG